MNKIEMHNVYSYLWSLAETFEMNTLKKRGHDQEMKQKICITVLNYNAILVAYKANDFNGISMKNVTLPCFFRMLFFTITWTFTSLSTPSPTNPFLQKTRKQNAWYYYDMCENAFTITLML